MKPATNKVCFYVMMADSGFAPNPFHGVCTLATCTPNHLRARLVKGDLIAGCFRSGKPVRVVYVMEVDEVPDLDKYYRDARFEAKKPSKGETWIERAGDNIYFRKDGKRRQDANAQFHQTKKDRQKDWRGDRVFIGKHFVYFGEKAVPLPSGFVCHLPPTEGIKYLEEKDAPVAFKNFRRWAFERPRLGRIGLPRNRESSPRCSASRKCQPC